MTPEIVARVDAWLASANAPQSLKTVWLHLRAMRYVHVDADEAIGAAMRGVTMRALRSNVGEWMRWGSATW